MAYIDKDGVVRVRVHKPKPKIVISKWEVVACAVLEALFWTVVGTSLIEWIDACGDEEVAKIMKLPLFLLGFFIFLAMCVETNLRHWKLDQKLNELKG